MKQLQDLLETGVYETLAPSKAMTVRDLLEELNLNPDTLLTVLVNGKKAGVDARITPKDEVNVIPMIAGGRTLRDCPDCGVKPGQPHEEGCDVERCSSCGGQRLSDWNHCEDHDPLFSRWTGIWPGELEAQYLGLDLNEFYKQEYHVIFFVKPREE